MTKFDDTNHTKLKNFMMEENQGTYTMKKINLIQIWYLESRIQYLEFRTFLPIK